MPKLSLGLNFSLGGARSWFRRMVCKHPEEHRTWIRNIYGDEVNYSGGMRSVWQCRDCDKFVYHPYLHYPDQL